ncbi:FAD-dependent oxidoreductase [Nocardioides sp.]|uniref:NAD(P)/FAD-dependent oxidoreductase n=1 Tax=Nocardioides sp. TaxID=35761 RepID=UPI002610AA27|nr:FAD-dependent oxidoreductase [Nocardioides sp.]MCW2738318.1 ferredoxin [Nocardioides sp.]
MHTDTLIIGASQAGLQLATSLRQLGDVGSITLLGGETHPPYQRPPLSKAYLKGDLAEDRLLLRGPEFFEQHRIELRCGEWIEDLELSDPRLGAGTATTRGGDSLHFGRLALTVGGRPRRLRVPGDDLRGIHYLRDVADAAALRVELAEASHVVVVGGGFVGLEGAAVARAAGKDVTVVEASDRLLSRAVDRIVSDFYADAHRRRGTTVLVQTSVVGFTGTDGRVTGVGISTGDTLPADVVIVGIGLLPRTGLAESIGLHCEGGVLVDEAARTSVPSVVAAGDCTVSTHPSLGHIRLESVDNAIVQARVAAATMLGVEAPPPAVPWFWSDQGDVKLQIAGVNKGYDRVVLRGDPDAEKFSLLYYRGQALVSIDAINSPLDYMAVRRILDAGKNVPVEVAGDGTVALRDFLRD